jgi:hypothetical protein
VICILKVRLDAIAVAFDRLRVRTRLDITENVIIVDAVALETVWLPILDFRLAYAAVPVCRSVFDAGESGRVPLVDKCIYERGIIQ